MKIIYFLQNHSINLPEIWSDCSIYVCLWLVSVVLLTIWSANNYKRSIKREYDVKTDSKVHSLYHVVDSLESENSYLKQAFKSYKEDMQVEISRLKQLERKRNNKGQFVATSGKGHGKKKVTEIDWTKATKEELLSEAKRRYPVGCKIERLNCNFGGDFGFIVNHSNYYFYSGTEPQLYCDGNLLIFDNGKWAKIIKS